MSLQAFLEKHKAMSFTSKPDKYRLPDVATVQQMLMVSWHTPLAAGSIQLPLQLNSSSSSRPKCSSAASCTPMCSLVSTSRISYTCVKSAAIMFSIMTSLCSAGSHVQEDFFELKTSTDVPHGSAGTRGSITSQIPPNPAPVH